MSGVATRIAVVGAALALLLGASQALFRADREGGPLTAGSAASGGVAAQDPSGNRLLPGDVRAETEEEPEESRESLTPRTAAPQGAVQAGAAPEALPASFHSPPSSTVHAQDDRPCGSGDLTPETMARARAAVRQLLVGGVTEVEREGAWYEVEFEAPGRDVEVVLDEAFNVVAGLDEDDPVPTATEVDQARTAARALAELGDVLEVELEDDGYEVEFSRPDETELELVFDRNLEVVDCEVELED